MKNITKTCILILLASSTLLFSACTDLSIRFTPVDPPEMELEMNEPPGDDDSIMEHLDNSFIAPGEWFEGTGDPDEEKVWSILDETLSDDPGQGLIPGATNNGTDGTSILDDTLSDDPGQWLIPGVTDNGAEPADSILDDTLSDDPGQGLIEGVTNNGDYPDSEEPYGEPPSLLDGVKFEKVWSLQLCFDQNLQEIPCEDEEPRDDDETETGDTEPRDDDETDPEYNWQ